MGTALAKRCLEAASTCTSSVAVPNPGSLKTLKIDFECLESGSFWIHSQVTFLPKSLCNLCKLEGACARTSPALQGASQSELTPKETAKTLRIPRDNRLKTLGIDSESPWWQKGLKTLGIDSECLETALGRRETTQGHLESIPNALRGRAVSRHSESIPGVSRPPRPERQRSQDTRNRFRTSFVAERSRDTRNRFRVS